MEKFLNELVIVSLSANLNTKLHGKCFKFFWKFSPVSQTKGFFFVPTMMVGGPLATILNLDCSGNDHQTLNQPHECTKDKIPAADDNKNNNKCLKEAKNVMSVETRVLKLL